MKVKCSRVASSLVELARGIELAPRRLALLEAHLQECPDCERRLESEHVMSGSLRRLAESASVPPWNLASEAALLAAFDAAQGRRTTRRRWLPYVAAAAALLAVATVVVLRDRGPARAPAVAQGSPSPPVVAPPSSVSPAPEMDTRPIPPSRVASAAQSRSAPPAAFVVWPGATGLPVFESGELMRVELPASVAFTLGLAPSARATTVRADVLIGQDGFARAIRLAP